MLRVYYCDCGQKMKVPEYALGQSGKCVKCGRAITVTLENTSPQEVNPTPTMSRWYYMQGGQRLGPISSQALLELARNGQIKPADTIRRDGSADWIPAIQAKGLFPDRASVPPRPQASSTAQTVPAPACATDNIDFRCPQCGKTVTASSDSAAKTGQCPFCGLTFQFPEKPDYYKANLMGACAALGKAYDLREAGERERAQKGFELAENWVREVLQTPSLPLVVEAEANCLLGTIYRFNGRRFADAQTALKKGLALGRTTGFLVNEEWFYAEDLGVVYDAVVQTLIDEGQLDQAEALLTEVEDFVSHYRSSEHFESVRHEGYILLARGLIAGHQRHLDTALQCFGRLIGSPYKEFFSSNESLKFVLGLALENIGRTYHFAYGHSEKAIPYIEASLGYDSPDDEDVPKKQALLHNLQQKSKFTRSISVGWGKVAWGSPLDEFLQTFPQAQQDDDWWLAGEAPGNLADFSLDLVKYAFNQQDQLYLIAFFPREPAKVDNELPNILGAPYQPGKAIWMFGNVEISLKAGGYLVVVTNTALDDCVT